MDIYVNVYKPFQKLLKCVKLLNNNIKTLIFRKLRLYTPC